MMMHVNPFKLPAVLSTALIVVFCLLLTSVHLTQAQGEACPGALPSRLTIGELAQVTPGGANNVRDMPTTSGARVGVLPAETVITVLDGAACADGFAWWRVATRDGAITGWTVESVSGSYALQPYTAPPWSPPPFPDGWTAVQSEGVALAIDPALGWTVRVAREEGIPLDQVDGGDSWIAHPQHVRVTLDDDGSLENGTIATLFIYPLRPYIRVNPTMGDNLFTLRDLLAQRPALTSESLRRFDFATYAAMGLAGKGEYLSAPGINGVRYVGHYTQDASTLPGGYVSAYFTGITPDGLHYIDAFFRLNAPRLPARDAAPPDVRNNLDEGFAPWAEAITNALPEDAFFPRLTTIDGIVRSIGVDPDAFRAYSEQVAALPLPPLPSAPVDQPGCTGEPLDPGTGFLTRVNPRDFIYPEPQPGSGVTSGWTISQRVRPLREPVCVNGAYWWLVTDERSFAGWVSETDPESGAYQLRVLGGDAGISGFVENTTQTPTECALTITGLSTVTTTITFRPSASQMANPMRGDMLYYADALLARPEGGNRYYRLVAGAVNRDGRRWDVPLWINANGVTPSEGCAALPVITAP